MIFIRCERFLDSFNSKRIINKFYFCQKDFDDSNLYFLKILIIENG